MNEVATHDLERLRRWIAAGGEVRVVGRSATQITLALLTCDGGEEMDRIVSADLRLLERSDFTQS